MMRCMQTVKKLCILPSYEAAAWRIASRLSTVSLSSDCCCRTVSSHNLTHHSSSLSHQSFGTQVTSLANSLLAHPAPCHTLWLLNNWNNSKFDRYGVLRGCSHLMDNRCVSKFRGYFSGFSTDMGVRTKGSHFFPFLHFFLPFLSLSLFPSPHFPFPFLRSRPL